MYIPLFAVCHMILTSAYNAQLARCILKGLSLQESTEIIQLIKHPPTLFNLSHFFKGYDPRFSKYLYDKGRWYVVGGLYESDGITPLRGPLPLAKVIEIWLM